MALRSNFEVQIDGGVLMSSFSIDSSVLNSTLNSDYIVASWRRYCLTINIQELTAPSATEALKTIKAPSSVNHLSPFEFPLLVSSKNNRCFSIDFPNHRLLSRSIFLNHRTPLVYNFKTLGMWINQPSKAIPPHPQSMF